MELLTGVSIVILILSFILAFVEFNRVKSKDQEIKVLSDSNIAKDRALKESKESSDRLSEALKKQMLKNVIIGKNLNELDFILSEAKARLQPKLWKRHFYALESLNARFEQQIKNPEEHLNDPEVQRPAPKTTLEEWIKGKFRVPVEDDPVDSFAFLSNERLTQLLQKDFPNANINSSVHSELISTMLKLGFKRSVRREIYGTVSRCYWKAVPLIDVDVVESVPYQETENDSRETEEEFAAIDDLRINPALD